MKSNAIKIAVSAFSSLSTIAILEIFVRVSLGPLDFTYYVENSPIIYHEKYGYYNRSNFQSVIDRAGRSIEFRTNSLGLRNPEVRKDRPFYNILAVGNSMTVGYGVEEDQAWPRRVERYLNGYGSDTKFQVINGGVSGYSLAQIRLLTEELIRKIDPEVIVLGLMTSRYWRLENPYVFFHGSAVSKEKVTDIVLVDDGFYYSPYRIRWLISVDIWMKKNFWIGAYLLKAAGQLYWYNFRNSNGENEPNSGGKYFKEELRQLLIELEKMADGILRSQKHFLVMLINEQEESGHFSNREFVYNLIVKRKCRELNVMCIDPLPELIIGSGGEPIFRLENDFHWSPKAHDVAAKELSDAIVRWRGIKKNLGP